MLNTQHTTSYNPNISSLFANQTINPNDTYLKIVQQCETPADIKSFFERLIAIHNISSTPEYQISINNHSAINELHPKFNTWVIEIFHNVTTNEIATLALLFDVFEEYKSNMQETPQNIKIRVIEKLFSKYGKTSAIEQLRNNIYEFCEDKRKVSDIKSRLMATPDIEQIATHGNIVNFNCKYLNIVCLLNEELTSCEIDEFLFLLGKVTSENKNKTIKRLDNIYKIMLADEHMDYMTLKDNIQDDLYNVQLANRLMKLL